MAAEAKHVMSEEDSMRAVLALVAGMSVLAAPFSGAAAGAAPSAAEHCTLEVVGINRDGSYATGDLTCSASPPVAARAFGSRSTHIAVHYEGFNLSGASLSIVGGSCSGGWLNVPPAWNDRIASTLSGCVTRHHRDANLAGPSNTTSSPGGNLSTVAFQVSSIVYN
jgi:hypothetical protein